MKLFFTAISLLIAPLAFASDALKRECSRGNQTSCVDWGNELYLANQKKAAFKIFEQACKAESVPGCNNLAYYRYQLDEKNVLEASRWYRWACDRNFSISCINLGFIEREAGNIAGAKEHYQKACLLGDGNGCENLAYEYRNEKNIPEAIRHFRLGCNKFKKGSCLEAAYLENQPNALPDLKAYYRLKCDEKIPYACNQLGYLEEKEDHGEIAAALFKKGCALGSQFACLRKVYSLKSEHRDLRKMLRYGKLDNGLTVVLFPSEKAERTRLEVRVEAGTDTELDKPLHLAHLSEHTVYRDDHLGTKTYLDDLLREGRDTNGETSEDVTRFFCSLPSTKTEWMIETFGKIFKQRQFSKDQVEKAKSEIAIETNSHFGNSLGLLTSILGRNTFDEEFGLPSTVRSPLSGLKTKSLTRDQVQEFVDKYYHPTNMQLILVGNFNPKDAMVWIRKNFGALSSVGKSPRVEASPKPRETPLIMNYSSSFLGHHIWLGTKYWNIDFADEVVLRAYFRYLSLHLMNRIRSQNAKTYTATDLFLSDTRRFGYGMVTMDSPPEAFEENFKYVTDRIRSETQEKRFLEADIKEMRQIFRNHEAAVDTDVESLYHLALAALYSKTTFGKIQSRVGTLEALSDADIRARLSKLFDPKKEIRMLIKPPLFFSYEEFVFFVLSILLGLFLGRRLFFRKENEVSRTDFQVAIRHGIWGRIQIYGGAFLVLALIGWVGREVVGLEVLRDLMRQSIVLRELVLSPIEILLKVLGVCLFLSRFVRRVSVVDGKLILRFRGYYSRTFPLHEIRVEPVSLLKGLFRNPRHAHPAYFGFRGKGLLISHRSGETFFVGVDDPKRAASEIRSLAEVTQPKASSG